MDSLKQKLFGSPLLIRVVPFVGFVILTALQGKFGEGSRYWFYLGKTIFGAWLIFLMRPVVAEMKWKLSWEAVVAGIIVFLLWVGLDPYYRKSGSVGKVWNPNNEFGLGSGLAWLFILVRIVGSSLVVPPLEEVFYRSFLYRYIIKSDFETVPLSYFNAKALVITALIFGASHFEWLAGILCALIYQGLVLRKNRLGDAMTAHAVTNFLLGVWVVWKGAWHFW